MRVCTLILLLFLFCHHVYGHNETAVRRNPTDTTKSKKAVAAAPKVVLAPGIELLDPFKDGNAADNGIRRIAVTLQLSNPAKADVKVQFALQSIHQLHPVLIDSVIVIKKEAFDAGTHNIQVPLLVRLNPVDSLPGGDVFELIKKGSTANVYRLLVSKWTLLPAAAISLAVASDTVPVYLKSDKTDKGIRTVILTLNLSSEPIDAAPSYTVRFTIPSYIQSLSKPKIIGQSPIQIHKADFGTGSSLQVPVVIQLTPVDSSSADEVIPILIEGDNSKAHNLVIVARKAQGSIAGTGGGGSDPAKPKGGKAKSLLHLDNNVTIVHPVLKKDVDTADHSRHDTYADVVIFRDTTAVADDTVTLTVDPYSFPYKPVIESQNPVRLDHTKWDSLVIDGKTKYRQQVQVILTNPPIDTLPDDEFANIRIDGVDDSYHGLRLTEKGMYIPNKPFWIEVGANFDISSGFTPTNLYTGVFLYKKDVAKFRGKKNISILGGVYEAKSISSNISSDSGLVYRDGRSYIKDTNNTYPIFRDTGTLSATTTVTSVGLFFSPQLRLTNGSADDDGLHVFVSIWAEMLWQTVSTSYDYSQLKGASGANIDTSVSGIAAVNKYNPKSPIRKSDYRSHYFGVGFPIYLKEKDANLYINPVIWGVTTQGFTLLTGIDGSGNTVAPVSKHQWNNFYLIQFRLSEERYGFTFTGEIRGLYGAANKPAISLAMSKKFNLDTIGEYIKGVLKF
jgi:hypothetical protein